MVYLIGALIGMGACCYVWFGHGEFFQSYGIYGVAALYGKREEVYLGHKSLDVSASRIPKTIFQLFLIWLVLSLYIDAQVLEGPLC